MLDLFDTHCHLDLDEFDEDRSAAIQRAKDAGVACMLIPSVDFASVVKIQAIAAANDGIYYAVGVHPNAADEWTKESERELRELIMADRSGRLAAVGEIGLDNYWKSVPMEAQIQALTAQLRVAYDHGLPVILHSREEKNARSGECSQAFKMILSEWVAEMPNGHPLKNRPGVFHSFSGDVDLAREYAELGFYFGFTGPITYKNAEINREVVKFLPSNKIIIETDSPYLSPVPYRGTRNEPAYVAEVALKIAETLHEQPETIAEWTTKNARRLFLGEEV